MTQTKKVGAYMFAPRTIEIMLVCYWYGNPRPVINRCWPLPDPARTANIKYLINMELIDEYSWEATDKGRAWVHAILSTPMPTAKTIWEVAARSPENSERCE